MIHSREDVVVCVPARNEAEILPRLLTALTQQTLPATIVIALNNTTDDSLVVVEEAKKKHQGARIVVDDTCFPESLAHAGSARRRAMDLGAELAGTNGILISTDADTVPPGIWIENNVRALQAGLDLAGGRIRLDPAEDIPPAIRRAGRLSDQYWEHVRAIEDGIDPVPWDPPPRHGDHTGASLAVRVSDYRACGGVPLMASGEDRALVRGICALGRHLGHPATIWTYVSARSIGRAASGMAAYMAGLLENARTQTPQMVPHFRHWQERVHWRRRIRHTHGAGEIATREEHLTPMPCDMPLTAENLEAGAAEWRDR